MLPLPLLPLEVHKPVAQPSLGEDVAGVGGVELDLLTQIGDVEAQEVVIVDKSRPVKGASPPAAA
jgi:hypothetical protein